MDKPTCGQVKEFRRKYGLTQEKAAAIVYATRQSWALYEKGEAGDESVIPMAVWELFQMKCRAGIGLDNPQPIGAEFAAQIGEEAFEELRRQLSLDAAAFISRRLKELTDLKAS